MAKDVYSLCFMCTVRCPIKVTVEGDRILWIQGNPFVAGIEGSLCPKGVSAIALLEDDQRLKYPMIRTGARGSGEFKKVTWDEALDYVAQRLKGIMETYGPQSIVLGERTNLSTHVSKTFLRAIGSPNHFTHDALCKGSNNTAFRSLFGYTDAEVGIDYANTKHIVLYGRNIFEAVEVKAVNNLLDAMEKGARLTYIDPRVTTTATKAHRYWMIRPGTDLALNYALMHVILKEGFYDKEFVDKWVVGLKELKEFLEPYTPEWAQEETGIPSREIILLAKELNEQRPHVIFHPGYRAASYTNEIYQRRAILMLNVLMGSIETKGGLFFKKGPGEVGKKAPRKLTDQEGLPKPKQVRFDKVGTPNFPLPDPNHGVPQMLAKAILEEDPYPIKALIANRFEPLLSIPDRSATLKALEKLELILTVDVNFSDIAWYSDVILPESTFLERIDCVQQANGLKPQLFLRQKAVSPRYDTKEYAVIIKELAERLGISQFFPYNTMEDLVRWQLEGTGFTIEDFSKKGFVAYTDQQIFWDRFNGLKLKTPSKKIEFKSSLLEESGFPSFPEYEPVKRPEGNEFRLVVGRCVLHTHVSTQNNPYLNELCPTNVVWINSKRAKDLNISDGQMVKITSPQGSGVLKAFVTDLIHPETVFILHGFGHESKGLKRAYGKGVADALLQANVSDTVGGSPGLHETFVTVSAEL